MTTLSCTEAESLMVEAVAGGLGTEKAFLLEEHLRQHPVCAEAHQELVDLAIELRRDQPQFEPSPEDLLTRIHGSPTPPALGWLQPRKRWGFGFAAAAAAAALVLTLGLGLGFFRPGISDEELVAWAMNEAGSSFAGDSEDLWEETFGDL